MAGSAVRRFLPLVLLVIVVAAQSLRDEPECPPIDDIIYSPFKPWFNFYSGSDQQCWVVASCVFIRADEARKQQFAATALIMGFIPLTLKDIAWPERRLVNISQRLPLVVEGIVRALGLEPHVTPRDEKTGLPDRAQTERRAVEGSRLVEWTWKQEKRTLVVVTCLAVLSLVVSYGALAVVEFYSKRSALGCVYPIFGVTWYLVAVVPAFVHVICASRPSAVGTRTPTSSSEEIARSTTLNQEEVEGQTSRGVPSFDRRKHHNKPEGEAAIQGGGEWWVVQFAWAVYYIAGTLFFTSIMAVTVIELVVWFLCTLVVTGASKLLALFLCMMFEVTGTSRYAHA